MNKPTGSWQTFHSHPMRGFFVTAALLAIQSALSFWLTPNAVILHRQLFLTLMLPAAYGGFLMAAMLEWTNFSGSLQRTAKVQAALLFGAWLALWFSPTISAAIVMAYWIGLLIFCTRLIWLDRNTKQFALLMLLTLFTASQAAYAYSGDLNWLKTQVHLHIAAVLFVSFRVSLLLGNEALKQTALKDPIFIPNVVYKNIGMTFLLIYAAAEWFLPAEALGFLAISIGMIFFAKLRELHHWELLRQHYVRTYYILQTLGAIGYTWLGYAHLSQQPIGTPLHIIAIATLLGGVLMVWLTAGLWHSGFTKLDYPKWCKTAFACLWLTALLRTVFMPLKPEWLLMNAPALLLAGVFALYLIVFIPIFWRNAFTDDLE